MSIEMLTISIRFALYANLMLLFGWPLFAVYALPAEDSTFAPSRRTLAWLTITAFSFSLAGIVAMAAAMDGSTFIQVDRATVAEMVFETPMGTAWQARMAALGLLLATMIVGSSRRQPAVVLTSMTAAIALASLAWTGHGAAGEGAVGWLQLVADMTHLLAAGAWIGALFAFVILLSRVSREQTADRLAIAHTALARFSMVGTVVVVLLVSTGLITSWILVGPGQVFDLFKSDYGILLSVKLLMFAAMLGLAAMNRFRLTPILGRLIDTSASPSDAFAALRRSVAVETAIAGTILVVVAWLGTLAPPMAN